MKCALFGMVVAALVAAPAACNPFDPNQSVILDVTSIQAPSTISPNTQLTVVLNVTTGGCLTFERIAVQRTENGALMTALGLDARRSNGDAVCTGEIRSDPHSYTFDPPFTSPFTIQVVRSLQGPLIATVTVQ